MKLYMRAIHLKVLSYAVALATTLVFQSGCNSPLGEGSTSDSNFLPGLDAGSIVPVATPTVAPSASPSPAAAAANGAATQLIFSTQPSASTVALVAFATQPIVTIKDAAGTIVSTGIDATATITLTLVTGTGSLAGTMSMSAVAGVADFSGKGLNIDLVGTNKIIRATKADLSGSGGAASFTADTTAFSITHGMASVLAYSTQPGTWTSASTAGTQPVIEVRDAFGNVVTTGVDATATISIALTTGTGVLSGTASVAAVAGIATFTGLSINLIGTNKVLTATKPDTTGSAGTVSASVASSAFTITHAAASQLVFITQPSASTVSGIAFATQPIVTIQDAQGNTVTSGSDATRVVTVSLTTGTGTLAGTLTKTAAAGVADFSGQALAINLPGADKVLTASATLTAGATTITSNVFTITQAAATQLVFTTQPSASTVSNVVFATQPVVTIQDAQGYTVTTGADATRVVTISLTTGTGTLAGTLTKTAVAGVADFSGQALAINLTGTDKVLTASAPLAVGTTTVTSNTLTITQAAASQLVFSTQPSTSTVSSVAFATQPIVTIKDAQGNVVTTGDDAIRVVTISLTAGTGTLAGTLTKTAVAGVADFSGQALAITLSGADKVLTASAPLTVGTTTVTSNTLTITHAAASQLVFSTQPSASTLITVAFAQQPIVTIKDAQGNVVTTGGDATRVVTVSLTTGTGTLAGTLTKTAVAGVADFSGQALAIDIAGTDKVLTASAPLTVGTTTVTSSIFTITQPTYNLSSGGYVIKEDATQLSTAVTITRDLTGVAGVVTVTSSDVSALTGSDYTASAITVNFASGDSTQTVAASNFTIADDATVEGDEFFKIKLAVTSGGVLGTDKQAMVTIVDNEATSDTGDFMFTQPLYTVNDTSSNATLTVIRTGSNVAEATVDVTFTNGSATGGTDYTATTQTLTFAASGAIEQTVSVPISGVSSNKSFFAKLTNALFTVAGTRDSVRAMSIAKVRILDAGDATVCDSTNDNTGTNLGFGGLSGGIYYICSATQLYKVRANPTLSFKVISDIDIDPTIDADSATGGTQAFTPLTAVNFTGNFDGNERIISNFTYAGSGAADNGRAFFSNAYAATDAATEIKGINMLYASVTAVGVGSGILIANYGYSTAPADQYSPQLTNNMVSGYLTNAGGTSAMIASNVNIKKAASQTTTIKNILAHGTFIATTNSTNYFGGILGRVTSTIATPVYDLQKLYNTANLISSATAAQPGGVIGNMTVTVATSAIVIDACENRGFISYSTGAANYVYAGGIVGILSTTAGLRITNSINYGTLRSAGYYMGGIVGGFTNASTTSGVVAGLDTCTNYGSILHSALAYGGGIAGDYTHSGANSTSTITGNINYGTVTNPAGGAGGIVSALTTSAASISVNITSNTNNGAISGVNYTGGIVGASSLGGAQSNCTIDIYNNSNNGAIHTGASSGVGGAGIIGYLRSLYTGTSNLIKVRSNSNSSTGTVYGQGQLGGIVGRLTSSSVTTANDMTIQVTSNTSSATSIYGYLATVSIGQIVGDAQVGLKVKFQLDSNTASGSLIHPTLNQGSSHNQGGILGLLTVTTGASTVVNTISGNTSSTVIRCHTGAGMYQIGGIVGQILANGSTLNVLNNVFTGSFVSAGYYVGGLVGWLNATGDSIVTVGGTAGTHPGTAATWSYSTANIAGSGYVGGLIGFMTMQGTSQAYLKYAYSTGNISVTANLVGGVVGAWDPSSATATSTISKVYSTGTVGATAGGSGKYAGGIVGYLGPITTVGASGTVTLEDSFAQGTVSGAIGWVGAIVGAAKVNSGQTLTVNLNRCYSTSSLSTTSGEKGGLIGGQSLIAGTLTAGYTSSYYRSDAGSFNSGVENTGGTATGTGMASSTAQALTNTNAQLSGSYTGWSIGVSGGNTTWHDPGVSTSYPTLTGF